MKVKGRLSCVLGVMDPFWRMVIYLGKHIHNGDPRNMYKFYSYKWGWITLLVGISYVSQFL